MPFTQEQKQTIKMLRKSAQSSFKDVDMLNYGFAIACVTVVFRNKVMHVMDFDADSGKCRETHFLLPETFPDMIKKLKYHCGEEKISKQLLDIVNLIIAH